jgi:hypothetical protein
VRDPRYQGLWADLAVFVASLVLFQLLGSLSREFILRAESDPRAKLAVGLFFLAVLLLQPWGPWLKRRPFHQRHPEPGQQKDSLAGCGVGLIAFCYLIALIIIAGAASTMISEVVLAAYPAGETIAPAAFLVGVAWAIGCAVVFVRFFLPPKKPGLGFLGAARTEAWADLSIYLNLILLQIVWGAVMSSAIFWEVVIKTPLGRPNSWTAILGRFIVLAVVALMVYLPPRIFFLLEQRRRRWAVLTMLVANLPIILKALLATGK